MILYLKKVAYFFLGFLFVFTASAQIQDSLLEEGRRFMKEQQNQKAEIIFRQIFNTDSTTRAAANAMNNLGLILKRKNDYSSALDCFDKASIAFEKHQMFKQKVAALINTAITLNLQGSSEKEITALFTAQSLIDSLNITIYRSYLYGALSRAHLSIKNYLKAEEYAEMAMSYFETQSDQMGIAKTAIDLGNIYHAQKRFYMAEPFFKNAIVWLDSLGDKYTLAIAIRNLAATYSNTGRMDSAIINYRIALQLQQLLGNQGNYASAANEISRCFLQTQQNDSAYYYLKVAERIANKLDALPLLLTNSQLFIQYFTRQNQKDSALFYSDRYIEYYHIQFNDKKLKTLLSLQESYDNKAKEKLIDGLQESEKELKSAIQYNRLLLQEEQSANRIKNLWLILAGTLFLALLLGFLFYRQRIKLEQIKAVSRVEQKLKKQVALHLHDQVAGQLSGLRLKMLSETKENDNHAVIDTLAKLYNDVRELSYRLEPVSYRLDDTTFTKALGQLFADFQHQRQIKTEVKGLSSQFDLLKKDSQEELILIIEEILLNTYKHSSTKRITIDFKETKEEFDIAIRDFGIGLHKNYQKGIGIKNIQSRIQLIHGSYSYMNKSPGMESRIKLPKKKNL